jgi:ABC-type sugar transport system ATPase subunit
MRGIEEATAKARPPGEILCELRGVGKQFGGVWACRNIDLEIRSGEVHAVLGENGAGKSTLMKLLHGVYSPDEGRITRGGKELDFASQRDAEEEGIAMIPQELDLFPDLSICENLFVGRTRPRTRFGVFDWRTMRAEARKVFDSLGVDIDVRAPVRSLSAANAQMVEIARALLRKAQVVLMDEPTAALSLREADRLFAIVRDLCAKGVGVVYITHRLDEVFENADRVTVLRDGGWVHTGPSGELDKHRLVELMVGRSLQKFFHRSARSPGEVALIVKRLGRRGAFRDVSFELRKGEIVGLAGLIGAGRSELAQAIFGIDPADAGEISVEGKPVVINNPSKALRHGIAYLPEERRSQGLHLSYSSPWNIAFGNLSRLNRFGLISERRERTEAESYKAMFSIRGDMRKPVVGLSGGNQQKVLLSKVLFQGPDIIMLDEPTRGVDVGARAEIYRIIDELANAGKAILLISSELNEVLSMADRILVMYHGRLTGAFAGPDFPARQIGFAIAGVDATTEGVAS